MQDGAASLLSRHLSAPRQNSSLSNTAFGVLKEAFTRLTARNGNAWTSGQWMTERVEVPTSPGRKPWQVIRHLVRAKVSSRLN